MDEDKRRFLKAAGLTEAELLRRSAAARADPPIGTCGFCGWTGPPPHWGMGMMLGTVADGSLQEVSFMTGMTFTCPRCGRDRAKTPDGLWRGFGEAVDASDLTAEQLTILGRYLSDAPSDVTPEDLVHAFPAAAPIINFTVHKHGSDWLTFLAIIVAVLVGYWAHLDSEKAASQSRPQPEGALRLTDEDIAKIAAQVERNLRHEQAKNARENKEQRKPGSK